MSNFICPTCGFNNIDCGKAGYKTDREIELEKKLEIAVKALEEYANQDNWTNCLTFEDVDIVDLGLYGYYGFTEAEEALAKIKEIKG